MKKGRNKRREAMFIWSEDWLCLIRKSLAEEAVYGQSMAEFSRCMVVDGRSLVMVGMVMMMMRRGSL